MDNDDVKSVALLVFGITQLSGALLEMLKSRAGMTDADLQKLWSTTVKDFAAARDGWKGRG